MKAPDTERSIYDEEVWQFIKESNSIENIHRNPTCAEVGAMHAFLERDRIEILDIKSIVATFQPGARIRDLVDMDVRVGSHIPPRGGAGIPEQLELILERANTGDMSPYGVHRLYETLQPFMDGNGRSGRALWAWQMLQYGIWPGLRLRFLHAWYYQSLT